MRLFFFALSLLIGCAAAPAGAETLDQSATRAMARLVGYRTVMRAVDAHAPRSWMHRNTARRPIDTIAVSMIYDGIAEYFAADWRGSKSETWSEQVFEQKIGDMALDCVNCMHVLTHIGGYTIVKPVLDADFKKGLACIVSHPLRIPRNVWYNCYDLTSTLVYQSRMLDCVHGDR